MKQEARTLGGKKLSLGPPAPKRHTEADEIRLGAQLFQDVQGFIDRDEQVPEELGLALEEWKENAGVLAHSPHAPTRRAFAGLYSIFDRGIVQSVENAKVRRDVAAWSQQATGGDFIKVTRPPPAEPLKLPPLGELEGRAFQIDPSSRRNASIMRNPIEMTDDGRALVIDDEGEVWDLTEALSEFNRPEVKEQIRRSMMGVIPQLGDVGSHTLGAMPFAQLFIEGAAGLFGADIRHLETASGGLTLPWRVGLGPEGSIRGDENELLKDPVWARALEETMKTVDPTASTWETFGHAAAGAADFALYAASLGVVARGAGGLAKAVLPTGPATVVGAASNALQFKPGKVWPMNSDLVRTMLSFGVYESVTKATNDETTLPEDFWSGLGQGFLFSVAGKAARIGRGLATSAVSRTPLGPAIRRMAPGLAEARKAGGDGAILLDQIRRFRRGTFSETVAGRKLSPYLRDTVEHAIDAHWMGVLVHSYAMAQQAPPGERFSEFWHGLIDKKSHATGFAFALAGALQYPFGVRPAVLREMQTPEGQARLKALASAYSKPTADTYLREVEQTLNEWSKKEPELFEGIKLVPPAEQKAAVATAAEAVKEAERAAQRPPDALPALKEMRKDQGNERPALVGEMTPAALRILLGVEKMSDAGIYKHALNAVHEYLRVVEKNEETKFKKVSEIPEALFRRMLDWRDKGKLPPGQMTLEEAAQVVSQVEAEPGYQELSPIEQVAKAKKTKRRPSLGLALRQVLAGKKTKEWLAETFPEGIEALKRTQDVAAEAWVGRFEAEVRKAWKQRNKLNLRRARRIVARMPLPTTRRPETSFDAIQAMQAGLGEVEFGEPIPLVDQIHGKELDVIREGIERGETPMPRQQPLRFQEWETHAAREIAAEGLAEHLVLEEEAGRITPEKFVEPFFAPAGAYASLNEEGRAGFMRAIERHTGAPTVEAFRQEFVANNSFREMRAENTKLFGLLMEMAEAQRQHQAGTNPFTTKRPTLADVFAGDPRMAGLTPEALEKEVLQLRAQAAAGDPGAMLAGPPETVVETARRASIGMQRLSEELKSLELLELGAAPLSPQTMEAMNLLAHGARPETVPEARWEALRAQAQDIRSATREALRRSMVGTWEEAHLRGLEDLWGVLDARAEGRDAPAEALERLKADGWVEPDGSVKTAYLDRMQQEAATHLQQLAETEDPGMMSGLVVAGFGPRTWKFTDVMENRWGRAISWGFWLDRPAVQRILGQPRARRVFNFFTGLLGNPLIPVLGLGPISRPQSTRTKRIMEQVMLRFGVRRGDAEQLRVMMGFLGSQFARHYDGLRAPQGDIDFYNEAYDKGIFAKARGPEDLEKIRPGSGYMWPIYTGERALFEETGRHFLHLGLTTQEAIDKLGGGRYHTHYHITEQLEHEARELGEGRMPIKYQGRSMPRDGVPNPADPIMAVPDAAYRMNRGIFDETQSIKVFGSLRDVMDRFGEWALSLDQVNQLGAFDRADYQRAGVRIKPFEGETLMQAVFRMATDKRQPPETLLLGARLQNLHEQMAKPGEKPGNGQTPYTKEKDALIKFFLGEGPDGPVYIPKPLAQQLEMLMSEIFSVPGENPGAKLAAVVDQIALFRKRALTSLRPSNWALTFTSNAVRNAALGGVPLNDFLLGMAGLPSFTRKGISGLGHVMRWIGAGAPKERPADWTEADWLEVRQAQEFMKIAGTSTSTVQTMGQEFVSEWGAAVVAPDVTKGAWLRKLEEQGREQGWTLGTMDRMQLAIEEKIARMSSGLQAWDTRILGWLNEPDPAGAARALASYTTAYNLMDLFFFKYPAYLKARHEWPDVPQSRILAYALAKTGNVSDAHPWLLTHLSKHGPWADQLWRASRGGIKIPGTEVTFERARLQMWASQILRHSFWTDRVTMTPAIIRASITHPIRSAAFFAAGIGASALAMAAMTDDEKRRWDEEARIARRTVARWPAISDKEMEAFKRFRIPIGKPGNLDLHALDLTAGAKKAVVEFWKRFVVSDPHTVPMPEHGGESRVGSIGQLFPAGQILDLARGYQRIGSGLFGAGESREKRQDFLQGVERLLGMNAQMGLNLLLGGVDGQSPISDALGGRGTPSEGVAQALFSILGSAGVMYPTLGLFAPEGQFLGEAVIAGGQRWPQVLRGVGRAYNPQDAGENIAGVGLRYLWPSRSILQREPLKSPVDGWSGILSEMYGEGFRATSEEGRAKMRAHRWVASQMPVLFADLYEQHFDEQGDPRYVDWTLKDRVAGALDELWMHTVVDDGLKMGAIEPGYEPKKFLLQQIAGQPEREQIIYHLRKWLERDRFQEDGMSMLLEAGQRAEMPKALFREAFRNALEDPAGGNLVKWWWSQAEHGDLETLGHLAPLMWDIQVPAENSDAFVAYRKLMDRYLAFGFEWPPLADGVQRAGDVIREEGHSEALQGGEAFRTFLLNRPERPTELERLLLNQR